jgi:hypothetical protein
MTYLSAWQSAIPSAQKKWIDLMVAQLGQNSPLTDDQIKTEINRLVTQMAAGNTRMLTTLFLPSPDEIIDSDGFNTNIDGIVGDLVAAFQESYNIGQLQKAYHDLYQQRIIGELRMALDQLESIAKRLNYMSGAYSGYNNVLGSNFAQKSYCTPRNSDIADLLYRDPRANQRFTADLDCQVDDLSKSLTLPLNISHSQSVESIEIASKQIANSISSGDFPKTSITNIIDGQANTYWIHQEVASSPSPDGLSMQLQLNLSGAPKFSIIELQPVAQFPYELSSLTYESITGETVDLMSQVSDEVKSSPIAQPVRLHLSESQGRKINIGFKQNSYSQVPSNELAVASTDSWPYNAPLSVPGNLQGTEVCLYTLGLDNIFVGSASYKNAGIYVSPMMQVDKCTMVALKTTEAIPSRHVSIEYYAVKQDFNSNNQLLQTNVIPLLPLDQNQVTGEELVFNTPYGGTIFNTGTPRFLAQLNGQLTNMQIYEEDRLMDSTEYQVLDDLNSQTPSRISINNQAGNLYYTLDYTPAHLLTMSAIYLTEKQDMWYAGSNVLRCALQAAGRPISTSKLFLVIIQRHDAHYAGLTPQVNQYQLLAASGA